MHEHYILVVSLRPAGALPQRTHPWAGCSPVPSPNLSPQVQSMSPVQSRVQVLYLPRSTVVPAAADVGHIARTVRVRSNAHAYVQESTWSLLKAQSCYFSQSMHLHCRTTSASVFSNRSTSSVSGIKQFTSSSTTSGLAVDQRE